MTTPRLCTSFKTREELPQTKLGNQSREEGTGDGPTSPKTHNRTRSFLSAEYKRCSLRRAARLSSRRPRRPALEASQIEKSMRSTLKHNEISRPRRRVA